MSTAQTPGSTPTPPVKGPEEYFNSSRLKVIGMITAATLAVGALGGIAGVVFDPEPITQDNVVQPGGDLGGVVGQVLDPGAPGNVSPRSAAAELPAAQRFLPGSDATDGPTSVGSVSPGTGGFSESPSTDATEPASPTSSPTQGGDTGDGSGVVMEETGVAVYVPDGWQVDFQSENQVFQSNGRGSYSFAFSGVDDPATAAGDIITANLQGLLPPENYTQLRTSDVVVLNPFGSVVSVAGLEYEALWVDNQGSLSIHGIIYVGVRQDGTVLGILVEHLPAEDFEAAFEEMVPIVDNSFNRFGGLG